MTSTEQGSEMETCQMIETKPIDIAVSPEEYELLLAAANKGGWSLPAFVADTVVRAVRPPQGPTASALPPEAIAQVCHEANRAYCATLGDHSQPAWGDAPDWQRSSAINGVTFHLANPGAPPSASHENWLAEKAANGWKYGPVKDPEKKEHPCCVPYEDLPAAQKVKDSLFIAVVRALSAGH